MLALLRTLLAAVVLDVLLVMAGIALTGCENKPVKRTAYERNERSGVVVRYESGGVRCYGMAGTNALSCVPMPAGRP
jgi:hypothetical protein